MSEKTIWPNKQGLKKKIGSDLYYLGTGRDLKRGKGWFCGIYTENLKIGFGFHPTNKFTAVRIAQKSLTV